MLGGLFLCCRFKLFGLRAVLFGWRLICLDDLDGWMVVLGVGGFLFGW